jgi:selenium metabolism protein YedF
MKIVDVKGQACPMPLIRTKKALKEISEGEALKVIINNESSMRNVLHFLEDNGISARMEKTGDVYEIFVNKQGEANLEQVDVNDYCEVNYPPEDFVLVFSKNRIGDGAEELGKMLVAGFLDTFKEMERLPKKVIFLNSGVDLVLKGSPVVPVLKEYELKGIELLACGTCLEYYDKLDEVAVGRVSNAYDILNATINAGKVINF